MDLSTGDLYLGRDVESGDPVIYPAGQLTTHAVIVGMTGSGKTGLGIDLIEEALLSGISCLIIDPKGDMGNLALNFPNLLPTDFEPWVDPAEAKREGMSIPELATAVAADWKAGLQRDEIDQERMRRLEKSADISIYTPGSSAGIGLNVLGSLAAPALDWTSEAEVIRDEIGALVSSLLTLGDVESDPVSGREHILLATIIEHFWRLGEDLDLAALVGQIPKPPFRKMGVFDLEDFFPDGDRMELAMRLNGLLASPSFAAWMEGRPIDLETMIGGNGTKAAVVNISHLSDEERQFLVTLLLGKMVTWIRGQPGTSELRTMIYMDEVFGFAPPTKEPPSKKPILTIMKQARAHGVGMVLSTQNPVDLDYKAMSNAGTWMIGRLQTENDKRRILEGLASASGEVDIDLVDREISSLEARQFVLHSTTRPEPQLFSTRWAMSYLAGPLTREQVTRLTEGERPVPPSGETGDRAQPTPNRQIVDTPAVAEGVIVSYLDPAAPWASRLGARPAATTLRPAAAATVQLMYDESKANLNYRETFEAVIFPIDGIVDTGDVLAVDHDASDFLADPPADATFEVPDVRLDTKTFWRGVETDLRDYLVANRPLEIWVNRELEVFSRPDESRERFAERCRAAAEDASDAELASLKKSFETKIDRVRDQMADAQTDFYEADATAQAKSEETVIGAAGDLLGAFLGGRSGSTALSRTARRRTAAAKARARADAEAAQYHSKHDELAQLEDELAAEVEEIVTRHQSAAERIEKLEVGLEKSDVRLVEIRLVWIPVADSPA